MQKPSSAEPVFHTSAARRKDFIDPFEDAWERGERPAIEAHLPLADDRLTVLIELVHIELENRLKNGEAARVEDYLSRFPELQSDAALIVEMIGTEYRFRRRREFNLAFDEYLRRFPQFAQELHAWHDPPQPTPGGLTTPLLPTIHPDADRTPTPVAPPDYEIIKELGRGGMGVVYLARQTSLDRLVALKMLLSGEYANAKDLARFQHEVGALAQLRHPNIISIHDVGEFNGQPFFCMDYLEGGSLAAALQSRPQEPTQAARWLETLARAMHAAHLKGIVHRDLKPANVLRDADGSPVITDFGLAKRLDRTALSNTGQAMGTPGYMPPEQAEGRKDVGPAADVYALGATLYELLTGRPPFKASTVPQALYQVLHEDPLPPRRLEPTVPVDLETVCLKCLEKAPARRYASALELAEEMERFLAGEPVRARPLGRVGRGLRWARRHPVTAVLVSAVVLVGVGLVGVFVWSDLQLRQRVREAKDEVEQANAQRRLAELDADLERSNTALAAGNGAEALALFERALERVQVDAILKQRQGEAEQGLSAARQLTTTAQAKREASSTLQAFRQRRGEALFQGTLLAGNDLPEHLQAAEQAARTALELFGVSEDNQRTLQLSFFYSENEHDEIVETVYELLLIRAEALSRRQPAEPERAKRLLDRAAQLGYQHHPTRSYSERRARYLGQLGADKEAAAEREQARERAAVTALDHFLLGEDQHRQGLLLEAETSLRKALEVQPDHFWARYLLAVCHLRLDREGEARIGLTACQAAEKDFVWVFLLRALANMRLKDFATAERDFRAAELLLQRRADPEAAYFLHVNRGQLWVDMKKSCFAAAELATAARERPERYEATLNLALLQALRKDTDRATETFAQAVATAERLHAAKRLEPAQLARVFEKRAGFWRIEAKPDLALTDLEEALRHWPRDGHSEQRARNLLVQGRIYRDRDDRDSARDSYRTALRAWPQYADAHGLLGELLLRDGQNGAALEEFDAYLRHGGEPLSVALDRAEALIRLRRTAEALAELSAGLKLAHGRPRSEEVTVDLLLSRARALQLFKAPEAALQDYAAVLKIDANNGEATSGKAFVLVGLKQFKQAVVEADRAAKNDALTSELVSLLASVYAQTVQALDKDPPLAARDKLPPRSECLDACMKLLRRALAAVPPAKQAEFWKRVIAPNPEFEYLRREPGFRSLESQFGQAAP